jgi:hypothetical protein
LVNVPRGPDAIWDDLSEEFFREQIVLRALDQDGDYRLSFSEIQAAPSVLMGLDKNRDGQLGTTECVGDARPGDALARRKMLMESSPVLRHLDANHDAVIDAAEIRNAAVALLELDSSHDRTLHPVEFLPEMLVDRVLKRKR